MSKNHIRDAISRFKNAQKICKYSDTNKVTSTSFLTSIFISYSIFSHQQIHHIPIVASKFKFIVYCEPQ